MKTFSILQTRACRAFAAVFMFIITLLIASVSTAQEPIRLDPQLQQLEFVPGVILVKLKDEVPAEPEIEGGVAKLGVPSVDDVLSKYESSQTEKLFQGAERLTQKQVLQSFSGHNFEQPSLHNIFKIQIREEARIFEAIEELNQDSNVVYAEPNYIFSIINAHPVSDVLSEEDMENFQKGGSPASPEVLIPNDPLYSQQWYIPAVQADAVWDSTTGDTTQIIGVLDTGVDWQHPDLMDNIWVNYAELNGIPGVDDDGNGFVDDIRGWDFINNDNDPWDDNSHGTHVAGIAAADGDNGIGIAGVNWHAKIMPIKVFQSSGHGDAATITQGIWYSINQGATVLNMSFGSYARSQTMEDALAYAYSQAVLVAAAGNDGKCIGPGIFCAPFFPAALSYVLGVQATSQGGGLAGFSNQDGDGPVYSQYPDLLNYELRAPGEGIISSIPSGNYRLYSGTSMSAALVSGSVALYRSVFPTQSQELMWGNLINTTTQHLNLFDALNAMAEPHLWFISHTLVDTLDGDGDGRVDAGETIELWFTVRNTWGHADSVFVGVRFGEFEDTTTAEILKPTGFVGSISAYAKRTNEHDPLRIHINSNVVNNRDIVFEALLWFTAGTDTVQQELVLTVENGEELGGVMDSTLVLTPDKLWLVNNSFRVATSGTLVLRPGTQLILNRSIDNRGTIIAQGTSDSLISIKGPKTIIGSGNGTFEYVGFSDIIGSLGQLGMGTFVYNWCIFEDINASGTSFSQGYGMFLSYNLTIRNSIIRNVNCNRLFAYVIGSLVFEKNTINNVVLHDPPEVTLHDVPLNWNHNNFVNIYGSRGYSELINTDYYSPSSSFKNNFIVHSFQQNAYVLETAPGDVLNIKNQYWGTIDTSAIDEKIYDFWDDPSRAIARYVPFQTVPYDSAHGIVWKVLVDSIDALDEQHLLDPLGPGPHRFDVYFNRPMDTTYTPQLSFGVREPYKQHFVTDSAHWSPDEKIWTAYYTIQLHTGDGVNRIRVARAKDPEGFEIPVEDQRFEFLIDAAGAASAGFIATAGLGKVTLEWETPDLPDILGYNMYRFTNITDTTYSDTVLINSSLIMDTTYVDFDVIPGKRYYYQYRVVRTNLTETDPSRVVSTIPLTASMGDANGDFAVDVLDIISIVSYILGQNPQPFIFEAADVNQDSTINVLDIVGVVNIILGEGMRVASTTSGTAKLELVRDSLKLVTDIPIAGIQFRLQGAGVSVLNFTPTQSLSQFEIANGLSADSTRTYLAFSLSGNTIPAGEHTIGHFQNINPQIQLIEAILSDENGGSIVTSVWDNGVSLIPTEFYVNQNYPNPFNASTTIEFGVPKRSDVTVAIYNILGQRIKKFELGRMNPGRYKLIWDGRNEHGNVVATGLYIYRMKSGPFIKHKKMLLIK